MTAGIVVAIFLAAAVPLILLQHNRGRGYFDERDYHHIAIMRFAQQWPRLDLSDYESMTTPGYHIILAGALRAVSEDVRFLRGVGLLFTVGLLATLGYATARSSPASIAIALCLPLVCSMYVMSSGIWMLPDNAAWWGVLGVLLIALRNRIDAWSYIGGGITLFLLIWMRQIHLWSAAVLWLSAWMGARADEAPDRLLSPLFPKDRSAAFSRAAMMLVATLPAFAVVYYFYRLWNGFTVPMYQDLVVEPSWSAPAIILVLFAGFSPFFAAYVLPRWREMDRGTLGAALIIGVIAGALAGGLPVTTIDMPAGRRSGVWHLVRFTPVIADRSIAIIALSTLGGALVSLWFAALKPRDRWIFLSTLLTFAVSQIPRARVWQRYYEPLLLILLALLCARLMPARPSKWMIVGPVILAILLAGVTVLSLTRESLI